MFILLTSILHITECALEPRIVNGSPASIEENAHSILLLARESKGAYVCGSSVLNQKILLTAAHCLYNVKHASKVEAYAGNAYRHKGVVFRVNKIKIHEAYENRRITNDISLIMLEQPLPLGSNIKRISIRRHSLNYKKAVVAGWGLIDEENKKKTSWLHSTEQNLWTRSQCIRIFKRLPDSCFCAGDLKKSGYASEGDSGSALVARDYIQLGIVSFKRMDITRRLVVYTNVSLFFPWITRNTQLMNCD